MAKPTTAPKSENTATAPAPVQPAPTAPPAAPAVAAKSRGVRWRQRTNVALKHLQEIFPDIAKSIDVVSQKLHTLAVDYAPNPKSAMDIEVGDEVTLPNHESIIKAMKADPVAEVTAVARGKATLKFSTGASMTVDKRDCRAVL